MAEPRRRKIHQCGESDSVPRVRGFGYYLPNDEFDSSIHSDEDAETEKRMFYKECENL